MKVSGSFLDLAADKTSGSSNAMTGPCPNPDGVYLNVEFEGRDDRRTPSFAVLALVEEGACPDEEAGSNKLRTLTRGARGEGKEVSTIADVFREDSFPMEGGL